MSNLQWLKLLLDLRKGWKSKTLNFGRLLTYLPMIDVAFFDAGMGKAILAGFLNLIHMVPFLINVTPAEATGFLVSVIGGLVVWLRGKTTESVEGK